MKLVKWFQSLGAEKATETQPDEEMVFYDAQRAQAEDVAKDIADSIDQIRKRADAWGKGALAFGSTGLTALGIGKLTDYAPDGHWSAAWIIIFGCALAVACLVFVATRLTKVSTPIVMNTRVSLMPELKRCNAGPKSERQIVEEIYKRSAKLNGASSFHAYAVAATLIEATYTRLSDRSETPEIALAKRNFDKFANAVIVGIGGVDYLLGDVERTRQSSKNAVGTAKNYIRFALENRELAEAKAELVRSEVAAVAASAQLAVVRQRMVNATGSPLTSAALVIVPVAIIAALVLANAAQSFDDTDQEKLQTGKACIDIAATMKDKGLQGTVPDPCTWISLPAAAAPNTDVLTEQSARADAIGAALDNYRGCLASSDQPATECAPIMDLLVKYGQS